MGLIAVQSDRLLRRIAALHELISSGPIRRRRQEIAFYAASQPVLQLDRSFLAIPEDSQLLLAIQFANLRYPFDEVLIADMDPRAGLSYMAVSRAGGFAEDAYVFSEAGRWELAPGPIFQEIEVPPFFEAPMAAVPYRLKSWVETSLAHAMPRKR
ncbi:hypothetical protein H8Z72_22505 (plasmid) [Xanthomonas citri pv. citri]|uniref:hypothetical protein n=1 Tax=Xanthomonas citri TaxID=346 RepID=UPI001933EE54|nr:hypothetical protein [Xanthomonas citri]QRD62698.1 hypothetical protein H8Z74_22575 [Xanthomonas citri pv. citri]QRD67233.1 hypothetical protein H8Z73_22660 [Xanthomonas citri pv. citri]QRD71722.1 hypothetical protein H8Z72_22505 [Xanthomonas citri pv. citri]